MLGTLRFTCALLVVANHLWLPVKNVIGAHAVVGFYIMSGFLMTRVMCTAYARKGGRMRYLANRALRIYPPYWLVGGLTVLALNLFPDSLAAVNGAIVLPGSLGDWSRNVLVVDIIESPVRLVPPVWSLYVELVFYLLIATGLSRHRVTTIAWWMASLGWTIWLIASDASFAERYTPPASASLFFSSGALLHHFIPTARLARDRMEVLWCVGLVFFAASPMLWELVGIDRQGGGFYLSAVLSVILIASAASRPVSGRLRRLDDLLGRFTYPLFLIHYLAGGIVLACSAGRLTAFGHLHFLLAMAISLGLCHWLIRPLENRLEALRTRLRERGGLAVAPGQVG